MRTFHFSFFRIERKPKARQSWFGKWRQYRRFENFICTIWWNWTICQFLKSVSIFLGNIHVLYLFKLLYLKSVFLGKRRIRPLMNYYLCSPHLLNQIGLNEINWIKLDQTDWIKPNQTRSYRFITIYWTYPCSNCTLCVYEFSQSKLKLLNNQIKKSVNPIPSGGTFFPPHY